MNYYKPTYEQYLVATELCALSEFHDSLILSWSTYNDETNCHDYPYPYLRIDCSDMFIWGSADNEILRWGHLDLFYWNLNSRSKFFTIAYICVLNELIAPENWFDHYKYNAETKSYSKIPAEDYDLFEQEVKWWKDQFARLESPKIEDQK